MSITDDIDELVYQNPDNEVSGKDVQDAFHLITDSPLSPFLKAAEILTGFDNESTTTIGILQYCHDASSGEVFQYDEDGVATKLTSQTHFADGTTILADRTVAMYHSDSESAFSYWLTGEIIQVTGIKTYQLPDDSTMRYIGFNSDGDLAVVPETKAGFISHATVTLHLNNPTSGNRITFANERHGCNYGQIDHYATHATDGVKWIKNSGLDVEGIENNGKVFTKITAGKIADEDLVTSILETTECETLFRDANGDWDVTSTKTDKLAHFEDSKCVYNKNNGNGTYEWAEINADYIVNAFVAFHDGFRPIMRIIGQHLYANRGEARDHSASALGEMDGSGFPTPEALAICSFIIMSESNGQIEMGEDHEIWMDHRLGGGSAIKRF